MTVAPSSAEPSCDDLTVTVNAWPTTTDEGPDSSMVLLMHMCRVSLQNWLVRQSKFVQQSYSKHSWSLISPHLQSTATQAWSAPSPGYSPLSPSTLPGASVWSSPLPWIGVGVVFFGAVTWAALSMGRRTRADGGE